MSACTESAAVAPLAQGPAHEVASLAHGLAHEVAALTAARGVATDAISALGGARAAAFSEVTWNAIDLMIDTRKARIASLGAQVAGHA